MPSAYDVVVSGAGPSGSRVAYLCARAGLSTLLLEKHTLPRDKCCAGGLLLRASKALGEQGEGMPRQRTVRGVSIWMSGRRHEWSAGPELGCTVLRRELDHHLVAKAEGFGCEVRTMERTIGAEERGGLVEVQTEGEGIKARHLILAEGTASGNANRVLGPYPRGALLNAAALYCEGDMDLGDRAGFVLPGALEAPTFNKSDARICAAFPMRSGVTLSTTSRSSGPLLVSALEEVARQLGLEPKGRGCCHPIAVKPRVRLASSRCLCVGDCAGLASPFSGEGLTPSLMSAELAARAVISSVEGGRPSLSDYEKAVRSRVERDQLLARSTGAALHLALRGEWASLLLAGLEVDREFNRAFTSVANHENGARLFLLRMLPRLPALLAKGAGRE